MADFEKSIPHILKWEGGYVWHPADPGGETNMGITDRLDGKVDGMIDLDGDKEGDVSVKDLTIEQAKHVYKNRFWVAMRGDEINDQSVADIMLDSFVNMGYNGLKIVQREAGVTSDGVIGPKSLYAINHAAPRVLFEQIKDARKSYYIRLAERKERMKVFLKGWLNRVDDFKY